MNNRITVAAGLAAVVLLSACGRQDSRYLEDRGDDRERLSGNVVHKSICVQLPAAGDIRAEKCVQDVELVSAKHVEEGGRKFLELCTRPDEAAPVKCETYAQTGLEGKPPKD